MKKILFLMVTAVVMCSSFVLATESKDINSPSFEQIPEKCEFSLNHYSGTIYSANNGLGASTGGIKVYLNTPQDKDVYATVYVKIDGKTIASKLFLIRKGLTTSSLDLVGVDKKFIDMRYELEVR